MDRVKLKYGLNEAPPLAELILLGLQWFVIAVPIVIIIGKIGAGLHFERPADQIIYIQKIFFTSGISFLVQLLWGHRLPLITGPATVLLVGVVAGRSGGPAVVYTAIAVGGIFLFLLSAAGLFNYIKKLFTAPVIATILILVAFTLTPMILDLITSSLKPEPALSRYCFVLVFVFAMFFANRYATGFWRSTLIMWSLLAGIVIHHFLFPNNIEMTGETGGAFFAAFLQNMNYRLSFEPGVIISFVVCFLALSINDLGAIYSVGSLLKPDRMEKRVTRGLLLTGLLNVMSGLLGVIGPVNFSLSPGVIVSTGCGYRYALLPAGIILAGISFMPPVIAFMGAIPPVVTGGILLYIMCSQLAVGLTMAVNSEQGFNFETGLVMGLPLMLSIIISFLPAEQTGTFPVIVRPILGNGFVVGVVAVLIMEHLICKPRSGPRSNRS